MGSGWLLRGRAREKIAKSASDNRLQVRHQLVEGTPRWVARRGIDRDILIAEQRHDGSRPLSGRRLGMIGLELLAFANPRLFGDTRSRACTKLRGRAAGWQGPRQVNVRLPKRSAWNRTSRRPQPFHGGWRAHGHQI